LIGPLANLLAAIDGNPNLSDLTVMVSAAAAAPSFRLTQGLPRLRRFAAGAVTNTESAGEQFAMFVEQFSTLEELELPSVDLWDAQLEHIGKLTRLKSLTIKVSSGLTPAGLQSLAGLSQLERLSIRNLRPISDESLKKIAALSLLKFLSLNQSYGSASPAGLSSLATLSALEWLDLSGAEWIDDSSIGTLAGLKNLRLLSVRNTRITNAGAERLQAALPGRYVYY
jgi:hypothetical protein